MIQPTTILRGLALAALVLAPVAALAGIPRAGQIAPAFSLARIEGPGSISLASLKGKPVYLNFFANWCGPCNEEAPSIVGLYKKYHPKGLYTLGIDELESKKKALDFKKKFHEPFEVVVDDNGAMGKDYGAGLGMPVHVFIDKRGKISTYRLGLMSPGEIDAAIRKIL